MKRLLFLFLLWPGLAFAQQALPPVGPPTGIACAYNTTPPTISPGFAAWVQCNSTGQLVLAQPQGTSSINTGQAAVATTSTLIAAARPARAAITLTNSGGTTVFVGNTGVTTTTGQAIPANGSLTLDTSAAIYGASTSGTDTVTYVETF